MAIGFAGIFIIIVLVVVICLIFFPDLGGIYDDVKKRFNPDDSDDESGNKN